MIFAVPVSAHDLPLLRPFVDVLKFLGGLHRHTFVFLPAPTVEAQTATIAAELNGLCEKLAVDAVSREPEGKWPNACNMHFRDSVEQLDKRGELGKPWMWLELDCTPIRAGWADRLELEYNRQGRPCLGVVRPVTDVMRDGNGKPTGEGDYMVGVGIYPPNFKIVSCLYKHLVPGEPFDIHIRWELLKVGIHNTSLIESRGRTGNYRINADGKIECDEIEPIAGYASHAGVVGDMAFLVHGMKDSTLAELVLSGKQPVAQQERVIEMATGIEYVGNAEIRIPATSKEVELATELEAMRKENVELKAMLAKLEQAKTISAPPGASEGSLCLTSSEAEGGADSPTVPSDAQPDSDPSVKGMPPIEQIRKVVGTGKKRRLADLAADLGVNQMRLRNLLKTPGTGLRIMQGGYVAIA